MRVIFVIFILFVLGCGLFSFENKLVLLVEDGINRNAIKISVSFPADKIKSEIWNGTRETPIPNYYGENDWEVIYLNELKASFRHFKTRNTDTHEYEIKVFKKGDRVFCAIRIVGVNELERELEFVKF